LNLIADSGIDQAVAGVEAKVAEAESRLNERRGELQKVQDQVDGVQNRLTSAQKRANDANDRLEKLKSDGLNFADPNAGRAFEEQVSAINGEYTAAMREAHMLEFGGYPKAEIDHSGDYVRGHYVEGGSASDLTMDKGLRHFATERDVAAAKVNKETQGLATLRADLDALRQTRSEYELGQAAAKSRIADLTPKAADAYEALNQTASEASAMEEKALGYLDQAAKQFEQTSRLAEQWASEGRQRTQNLSSELKQFSADERRANNRWFAGYTLAQTADARAEKACVFYVRQLASAKGSLDIAEVDVDGERAKAAEAKKNGVEEIKLAMAALQKAHRDVGNHWTVAAQAAGITDLLALFGESDYVADAIAGYRNALKGRENEPYVEKFAQRLKELEGREGR
jgi:chromosome segregation ATPase